MPDTTLTRLSMVAAEAKRLRKIIPRSDHADLNLPPHRDVINLVHSRNEGRLPDLIPVRIQRMSESPFAFFRGSADLMSSDLAVSPNIGLNMVICGDAHLANFGLFASPERRMLFDLNDFDESGIGPWEWDIKRLAASAVLAAREGDESADSDDATIHAMVVDLVHHYRLAIQDLASRNIFDRFYADIDTDWIARHASARAESNFLDKSIDKARNRTSLHAVRKIATFTDKRGVHFQSDPPILVPVTDQEEVATMVASFDTYLSTLPAAANLLLKQFRVVDVARRVVGVGSVGTRSLVILLAGPNEEPLVLQVKEALPSVLTTHGGLPDVFSTTPGNLFTDSLSEPGLTTPHLAHLRAGNGYRVVASQQILQAHSDPLLGWTQGVDGRGYYWRQFRDMKGSVDVAKLNASGLTHYCQLCARLLARAHSQSPNNALAAAYIGSNDEFPEAIATWAVAYANQTETDYKQFCQAIADGEFPLPDPEADAEDSPTGDTAPHKSAFDSALGL